MADEARGRGVSVTIKYGKGYEESWANFTGLLDEVRQDICTYFGVEPESESVTGLTLSELVVNVTSLAHGKGNAAAILGAVALPASSAPAPAAEQTGDQTEGTDPWAAAGSAPAEPEGPNPLFALIEEAADVPALQRIWAENQAAFADEAVMAAWKAKGKSLQGAAA